MNNDLISRVVHILRVSGHPKLADEAEGPLRMAVQEAEWFRWLRDNALCVDAIADPDSKVVVWYGTVGPEYSARGNTLQDAVVAAMEKTKEG